jgi:hypothetical protein
MESMANNKKVKVFRSKQEIEQLLKEHAQSGQSVKSFCAGLQISEGTFYHWKEKYAKSIATEQTGFMPVKIVASASNGLFAEVGNIKIYQPVSAAYLKELLV